MSNQEILEKAVQKAVNGGWRGDLLGTLTYYDDSIENLLGESWAKEEIIYNKKFAKALWGEKKQMTHKEQVDAGLSGLFTDGRAIDLKKPGWQYHLQQMVIAEDSLQYLAQNM